MSDTAAPAAIAIFAHNEARRIAACLGSLPLDRRDMRFHLLINGSTDRTAEIARQVAGDRPSLVIHELTLGGKARTWNRFVHEILPATLPEMVAFMDGDAEIAPGSFDALARALATLPGTNAIAGMPLNGRSHHAYQAMIRDEGGLFGDLYALRGSFLARIRAANLRLPVDLVGDDGLVAAWAATDLGTDAAWDRNRLGHADEAGFLCEPMRLASTRSWRIQYKRMIAYAARHYQGRMISRIMGETGPAGLPERLSSLYAEALPGMRPRGGLQNALFDRLALRRMAKAIERRGV